MWRSPQPFTSVKPLALKPATHPKPSKSAENTKKQPPLPNFLAISKPLSITSKLYPLSHKKVLAASVSALEGTSPTLPLLCPQSRLQRRSTAPVSPLKPPVAAPPRSPAQQTLKALSTPFLALKTPAFP